MLHVPQPFVTALSPVRGPRRICFFLNAQIHQALHVLPIAIELARDPDFSVDVLAASRAHLDLARRLAAAAGADAIRCDMAGGALLGALARLSGASIPPKLLTLAAAARRLGRYDALVVPERTSLLLLRMGVGRPLFIHTAHGAGDRAVGFDRRIAGFDFALVAGEKQRRRLLDAGLIRRDAHAVVGYPKFDAVRWLPPSPSDLFEDDRPVVLYNPHCDRRLSSWKAFGETVIRQFANDRRYNLIVAPHVKLFDDRRRRAAAEAALAPFAALPNIHVDLGSLRSCDMSYAAMADVYLGDVSSQVYEYLARPRPCLFLDGHGADWRADPSYRHWRYGPVLDHVDRLADEIDAVRASHHHYLPAQREGLNDTFDIGPEPASVRAARAIGGFVLERTRHD
ncbi:hypothetical protein [Sphingomonas sp. YL-JM2C]